jgi:hypothetical protein
MKNTNTEPGVGTNQSIASSGGLSLMAPGAGGRHTSMHEYLQSGIDGMNVGVGGFSQGNPANF